MTEAMQRLAILLLAIGCCVVFARILAGVMEAMPR